MFVRSLTRRVAAPCNAMSTHASRNKHTLVLIRHGESEWNKTNQFTGWHDVPLSEKGHEEAQAAGRAIAKANLTFDVAYTSYLRRAIRTCWHVLEQSNQMFVPVINEWRLNERHYGALTGLDKAETVQKHGKEQVLIWRRSYDIPPPQLTTDSEYYPGHDRRYKNLKKEDLPLAESLEMTAARVQPKWDEEIAPAIRAGKNVLIAAHGNSLRALIMQLDNISKDEITDLNVPTGVPLVYHLDDDLKPIPHPDAIAPLSGYYLGNQEEIRARILGVKNQTK
ncbi:Aste57867_10857 [Aphanomyces stellatus]|uniref:Phosphoglycerate mutase n=1 Tax=Aphanomyces stellatus TaxID=120398 RepID=A0A485KRZ2_9STRA|nr:hypothetical protein As57867_010817 [Aphanomyces stellatus]VFT87725.1 Aste57867_10857 [Aphanomyces stellatus]